MSDGASREQLLADPRSGARPLRGSSGARPARRPRPSAGRSASPRPRRPPASSSLSDEAVADRKAVSQLAQDGDSAEDAADETEQEPQPTTPGPRSSRAGEQVGGSIVAFFVAYPLALNLLKGGPPRMWGWIKAKWVNEPYLAPGSFRTSIGAQVGQIAGNTFGGPPPTPSGGQPRTGTAGNPVGVL